MKKKFKLSELKEMVKARYEKEAIRYDNLTRLPKKWRKDWVDEKRILFKLINPRKNEVALDVGCGTGIISIKMAKRGAKIYGLDISAKMIEKFKEKIKKQNFKNFKELRVWSMGRLPYKSKFFDIITCCGVMDHYPINFAKKCLIEMKRVLKNNGRIVIDFPNEKSDLIREYVKAEPTLHLYSEKSLKNMIKSSSLEIADIKKVGMGIQFLLKPHLVGTSPGSNPTSKPQQVYRTLKSNMPNSPGIKK